MAIPSTAMNPAQNTARPAPAPTGGLIGRPAPVVPSAATPPTPQPVARAAPTTQGNADMPAPTKFQSPTGTGAPMRPAAAPAGQFNPQPATAATLSSVMSNPNVSTQQQKDFQANWQQMNAGLQTAGQTASSALQGTAGDLKSYMAARGATPVSTLGSGQPRNFGQAMQDAALGGRGRPAAPAAVTPNKGRTTSMQRRGIGAGQAQGQPVPGPGRGRRGMLKPLMNSTQAAQKFLSSGGKANPAPQPTPQPMPVTSPVSTVGPGATVDNSYQPTPKPVTV